MTQHGSWTLKTPSFTREYYTYERMSMEVANVIRHYNEGQVTVNDRIVLPWGQTWIWKDRGIRKHGS